MMGPSARPGGQLCGKPTLLLSGKEEADRTEAFAERAQPHRELLRRGSAKAADHRRRRLLRPRGERPRRSGAVRGNPGSHGPPLLVVALAAAKVPGVE